MRAGDGAGNVDASPAARTWTVDTVAPESSFTVVPADPSNNATPTFEFSADEAGSTLQCRVDTGAWTACTSPATTPTLADGSHTFSVRATDQAGNEESTPESYTWLVDAGAPSVQITQPSGAVNTSDSDPYTIVATTPDGDVTSVEFFRCSDVRRPAAPGPGSLLEPTTRPRTRPPGRSMPTATARSAPWPPTPPPTRARTWST